MDIRYNSRAGLIFGISVGALVTLLPRLIRLDFDHPLHIVFNFLYLSLTFIFYWLTHHFFILHFRSGRLAHRYVQAVVSIVCSVAIVGTTVWVLKIASPFPLFANNGAAHSTWQALFVRIFRWTIVSAFTWFAVYYYRLLLLLQQSRLDNARLHQENLSAQLASLREQISPHFLFNSLNTLSTLSQEEPVKEYVQQLSEVYRYVLQYQQRNIVPVKDELAFVRSYVYILESRFEDGLKVDIRIDPASLQRKILPFSLQLLVENAVKHNAISYTRPLAIDIYDEGDSLIVENDLVARATMHDGSSTGLDGLAKRYRLTAAKEILITRDRSRFKVQIPFLL